MVAADFLSASASIREKTPTPRIERGNPEGKRFTCSLDLREVDRQGTVGSLRLKTAGVPLSHVGLVFHIKRAL